ncbi:hypothetical protein F8388_011589 [Cannabis sativa]|uniref:peroxidase n=1 Tax=Cannabis sativa TaxID=3483 RepID=A0A7J6GXE0_CANSA|nr:hypothetical protein G4B88_015151 [Cannabis sativa]KAF4387441.1 hypothetical protein F8388_011589 [Cannabis sativa]
MGLSSSFKIIVTLAIVFVVFTRTSFADDDDLSSGFYSKSCPKVFSTVKSAVHSAISNERRIGASLLRLHFHDCFVNLVVPYSNNFMVKNLHEMSGPLHMDRLVIKQGMAVTWQHRIGAHTIGKARCTTFRDRIYNESNIDSSFAKQRQNKCPRKAPSGDNNVADLDVTTPTKFDNLYFKNLLSQKGLLHSDQILFNGGSTDSVVKRYSSKPSTFAEDFVKAMIKMGDIEPLTGSDGEIRKHCAKPN